MLENPIALVGVDGADRVVILSRFPLTVTTKEQAIDLAVRLVAVADDGELPTFGRLLREFLSV